MVGQYIRSGVRNKHYKKYSYRLSKDVVKGLKELKEKKGISWNLLFKEFLRRFK